MKGKHPCPKCGTNDWNPVLDVDGPPYDECKKCGYKFTSKDVPMDFEKKAEKWLWDSCGYAPDTSVKELADWMEKAENWDKYEGLGFLPVELFSRLISFFDELRAYAAENTQMQIKAEGFYQKLIVIENPLKMYEKLEAVKNWLKEAKAQGRISMNAGYSLGLRLGIEEDV